jgi:hypothetical protein
VGCDAFRPFANMKSKVASGNRESLGKSLVVIEVISQNRSGGVGAVLQSWTLRGKQSGLQTHIVTTESVSLRERTKS